MLAENADAVSAWYNATYIPKFMQYSGLKATYNYKNQASNSSDYFTFFMYPSKVSIDSLGTSTYFTQAITEMNTHWQNGEFTIYLSGNYDKIKSWVKEDYRGSLEAVTMVVVAMPVANEAAINKWYNETHIPLIMKYPGVKKVVRYWRTSAARTDANPSALPKFITMYYYGTKDEQTNQESSTEWAAVVNNMNTETIDDQMTTVNVVKLDLSKSFVK
jgi:hypothetical protein